MDRHTINFAACVIVAILTMVLCSTVYGQWETTPGTTWESLTAEPNNAPGDKWAIGTMVGDNTAELRLGGQLGSLEAYIAPRFEIDRETEGDIGTGLRGYFMYSAIDANMATSWFGQHDLPDGLIYVGLFGGTEFQDGEIEGGYLIGARVDIGSTEQYQLDLCTEYQYTFTSFRSDDDRYTMVAGPRLMFK